MKQVILGYLLTHGSQLGLLAISALGETFQKLYDQLIAMGMPPIAAVAVTLLSALVLYLTGAVGAKILRNAESPGEKQFFRPRTGN